MRTKSLAATNLPRLSIVAAILVGSTGCIVTPKNQLGPAGIDIARRSDATIEWTIGKTDVGFTTSESDSRMTVADVNQVRLFGQAIFKEWVDLGCIGAAKEVGIDGFSGGAPYELTMNATALTKGSGATAILAFITLLAFPHFQETDYFFTFELYERASGRREIVKAMDGWREMQWIFFAPAAPFYRGSLEQIGARIGRHAYAGYAKTGVFGPAI